MVTSSRALRWMMVAAGLVGIALFAWTLSYVGYRDVLETVRRIGWGFLIVLALGGARFVVRAHAWTLCVTPPVRLGRRDALAAAIAGDALSNVTSIGLLASEPTKVVLAARMSPPSALVPSVAIEHILYSASVGLVIAAGALLFLRSATLAEEQRLVIAAGILPFVAGVLALVLLARTRRRPSSWLAARAVARWPGSAALARWAGRITRAEAQTLGFAGRDWPRWLGVFGVEMVYHALAVLEVWFILASLAPGARPTLQQAFIVESASRFVSVVFKFVPFRVGVDEAGSGLVTGALALGPVTGVALAVVRKARVLCFTGAGMGLLLARSWRTP